MKKREGTALALYPVKERLKVFAPVLINCVTVAREMQAHRAPEQIHPAGLRTSERQTLAPAAGV